MKQALLALFAATQVLALAGEGEEPLARWSFEEGVGEWRSADSAVAWSRAQALDGTGALRLDVAFPRFASVSRPVGVEIDLVERIVYHVYVPEGAPETIETLLFLKDKDGLWFQHFRPEPLRPGMWNEVSVDVGPRGAGLRPGGHHQVWNSVAGRQMTELGVKFFTQDRFAGSLHLDGVVAYPATDSAPPLRVLNLRENAVEIGRYEKFEATFDLSRDVVNPFDPDEIQVDATFIGPSGKVLSVPGFYHQGFVRRLREGREELVPVGAGRWKVRFAPVATGRYSYYLYVRHTPDRPAHGQPAELITGKRTFGCVESESRGFVRVSKKDPLYFELDSGEWFYPIGHNVHSPSDDTPRAVKVQNTINASFLPDHGTFSYDTLFAKMAAAGENFAEVWLCSWWVGLEWVRDWQHFNGLTRYNQHSAWRLDYLMALAARHGIYLHLVLDNHGKVSTWVDDEWADNPYNQVNGGFLDRPEEFFENPHAKALYKKKLRYIVARWAYGACILGFELWSEVDLVGSSFEFHQNPVLAAPKIEWHREMSSHLRRIDPWDHLITTHVSGDHSRIKGSMAAIPNLDYLACNVYRRGQRSSVIGYVQDTARALNSYGKPGFVTEFGGHWLGSSAAAIRADLHFGLWSTYLTATAASPLLWWFQFIDADDLYWNYKALAAFHRGEDRRGQGLANRPVVLPLNRYTLSAMGLQNDRMAYVWVYSRSAARAMPPRDTAPVHKDVSVRINGLHEGAYRVEVWDTHKGTVVAKLELAVQDGALTIPLPEFRIDCALKIKPAS